MSSVTSHPPAWRSEGFAEDLSAAPRAPDAIPDLPDERTLGRLHLLAPLCIVLLSVVFALVPPLA